MVSRPLGPMIGIAFGRSFRCSDTLLGFFFGSEGAAIFVASTFLVVSALDLHQAPSFCILFGPRVGI